MVSNESYFNIKKGRILRREQLREANKPLATTRTTWWFVDHIIVEGENVGVCLGSPIGKKEGGRTKERELLLLQTGLQRTNLRDEFGFPFSVGTMDGNLYFFREATVVEIEDLKRRKVVFK